MKNFGEKEAWAYPGTAQIFWVPPIISGTGKATDFEFSQYIRIKAREKNWRKGSVGVSRDCPIFGGTPIISGTEKATDFKFCMHIYRLNRNKSHSNNYPATREYTSHLKVSNIRQV